MTSAQRILIFDGVCFLCNGVVRFIIRHDKRQLFKFTPMQSDFAQQLLADLKITIDVNKSFVLVKNGQVFTRSDAALEIARDLSLPWRLAYCLKIVPRLLRDAVYAFIARHRYRWFGRADTCIAPTPEQRSRFLG